MAALNCSPNSWSFDKVLVCLGEENYSDAANYCFAQLERHPDNQEILNALIIIAQICNNRELYGIAQNICNRALEIDPTNLAMLIEKSFALCGLDQYQGVLDCCWHTFKLYPGEPVALDNVVTALKITGHFDDAQYGILGAL